MGKKTEKLWFKKFDLGIQTFASENIGDYRYILRAKIHQARHLQSRKKQKT